MTMNKEGRAAWRPLWAALLAAGSLAACGGGGDGYSASGYPGAPLSCQAVDVNLWMADYLDDWYLWSASRPQPDPFAYGRTEDYFNASLYQGTDTANFPVADKWSYAQSTASFNQFWGAGRTLGYGVMVAGKEVTGFPAAPLYVRYIEPGSPAAKVGLARGDQILSVNGVAAATLNASGDFSALSPNAAGDAVTLVYRNATGDWQVTLTATTYNLVPVSASVTYSAGGRKVGYVAIKDMVSQAEAPLDSVFNSFKSQGVQDVVIDLRYNGGGLISTASKVASYPARASTAGGVFSTLLYNAWHQGSNQSFYFANYANATDLSRVYVLTGLRTCSASEQLINGLRPFVQVITVGDTTCGKPVGFTAVDDTCGTTWSAVNFESANARNEGRYFAGFDATCPVAEDFTQVQGGASDPLMVAALSHADTGLCPATAGVKAQPMSAAQRSRGLLTKEPEHPGGMLLR